MATLLHTRTQSPQHHLAGLASPLERLKVARKAVANDVAHATSKTGPAAAMDLQCDEPTKESGDGRRFRLRKRKSGAVKDVKALGITLDGRTRSSMADLPLSTSPDTITRPPVMRLASAPPVPSSYAFSSRPRSLSTGASFETLSASSPKRNPPQPPGSWPCDSPTDDTQESIRVTQQRADALAKLEAISDGSSQVTPRPSHSSLSSPTTIAALPDIGSANPFFQHGSGIALHSNTSRQWASRSSLHLDTVREVQDDSNSGGLPSPASSSPSSRHFKLRSKPRERDSLGRLSPMNQKWRSTSGRGAPSPGGRSTIHQAAKFMRKHLGDSAMRRRHPFHKKGQWDIEGEIADLWAALWDGVLLCRLVNLFFANAVPRIDRRDIPSARVANLQAFSVALQTFTAINKQALFSPSDLAEPPRVDGIERVAIVVLALRDAVEEVKSSDDDMSELGHEAGESSDMSKGCGNSSSILTSTSSEPVSILNNGVALGAIRYYDSPLDGLPHDFSDHSSDDSVAVRARGTRPILMGKPSLRQSMAGTESSLGMQLLSGSSSSGNAPRTPPHPGKGCLVTFAAESQQQKSQNGRRFSHGVTDLSHLGSGESDSIVATAIPQRARSPSSRNSLQPFQQQNLSIRPPPSPTPSPRTRGHRPMSFDAAAMPESRVGLLSEYHLPTRAAAAAAAQARLGKGKPALLRGVSISEHVLHTDSPRLRAASRRHSGMGRSTSLAMQSNPSSESFGALGVVEVGSGSATRRSTHSPQGSMSGVVPFPRSKSTRNPSMKAPRERSTHREINVSPENAIYSFPSEVEVPSKPPRTRHDSDMYGDPRIGLGSRRWSEDGTTGRPRRETFSPVMMDRRASDQSVFTTERVGSPSSEPLLRQVITVRQENGSPDVVYRLGECIGRGQFGSVYKALNVSTGRVVAIKRIATESRTEQEILQLANEVAILQELVHPSVVRYECMVQTDHYVNIILEYAENGSLAGTHKAFGNFDDALMASYVAKILEGLIFLHGRNVVHCDLKGANILTTKNGNVKLSDFGVSLNLNQMQNKAEVSGTPNWMAPEVIQLEGASTASDIWSLGCTIVELISGKPPYGDLATMSAMYNIVENDEVPIPVEASLLCKDFLLLCFAKNPEDRATAKQLWHHEWIQPNLPSRLDNALQPQDSVPFLKRMSMEMSRERLDTIFVRDASQASLAPFGWRGSSPPMPSPLSLPEFVRSPNSSAQYAQYPESQSQDVDPLSLSVYSALPPTTPSPPSSSLTRQQGESIRVQHKLVKGDFKQLVTCKLCQNTLKRHALTCEACGLICHAHCAEHIPTFCDQRNLVRDYVQRGLLAPTPLAAATQSQQSLVSNLGQFAQAKLNRHRKTKSSLPGNLPSGRSLSLTRSVPTSPNTNVESERTQEVTGLSQSVVENLPDSAPPKGLADTVSSSGSAPMRESTISAVGTSSISNPVSEESNASVPQPSRRSRVSKSFTFGLERKPVVALDRTSTKGSKKDKKVVEEDRKSHTGDCIIA